MTTKAILSRSRNLTRRLDKAKALLDYFGRRKAYRRSILRALEAVDAVFVTHMETDGDSELVEEAYDRARRAVLIVDQLAGATWREVLAPGVN